MYDMMVSIVFPMECFATGALLAAYLGLRRIRVLVAKLKAAKAPASRPKMQGLDSMQCGLVALHNAWRKKWHGQA
jgi:hypothetical protein